MSFFVKQDFRFIEYDSGPCTADQLILQADKNGYSLVESVSADFEMDKGLVKCFERSFNHKDALKSKGKLEAQEIQSHLILSTETEVIPSLFKVLH